MDPYSKYHFYIYFCENCKINRPEIRIKYYNLENLLRELKCGTCGNFFSSGNYISENEFINLLKERKDENILESLKEVIKDLGLKPGSDKSKFFLTAKVLSVIKEGISSMGDTNTRRGISELKIILGLKKEEVIVRNKVGKSVLAQDHSSDDNFGPHSDDFLQEDWEDLLGGPDDSYFEN